MTDPAFILERGATSMRITFAGPLTITTGGLEVFAAEVVGAVVEDWEGEHRGTVASAAVAGGGVDLLIEWTS